MLAVDQQILVLTSLGPSPPVIGGGGPLIPGAARVTTWLSNKFGEREPVVQCRPGESEKAIKLAHTKIKITDILFKQNIFDVEL